MLSIEIFMENKKHIGYAKSSIVSCYTSLFIEFIRSWDLVDTLISLFLILVYGDWSVKYSNTKGSDWDGSNNFTHYSDFVELKIFCSIRKGKSHHLV